MDKTIGQAAFEGLHGIDPNYAWADLEEYEQQECETLALAAVKHALARLKVQGWELKPRKSSDQMCRVWGFNTPDVDWEVMFNAAPEPDIEALLKEQK